MSCGDELPGECPTVINSVKAKLCLLRFNLLEQMNAPLL